MKSEVNFMKEYMNSKEISELLEINLQQLNYKIKTEQLPKPELIIGKTRLWERRTVETFLLKAAISVRNKLDRLEDDINEA